MSLANSLLSFVETDDYACVAWQTTQAFLFRSDNVNQNIDYVQSYIDMIESGEVKVGGKIKAAIKRHKADIERSKDPDYPYYYDPREADAPIMFIEMLPDPKSRKPNKLARFQKFIIGMIYGWRKKKNNTRRFTKAYISVARKNGKSLLVSGIALYELIMGQNPKASRQVYSAANTKDQARIVFNMVKTQLKALRSTSKGIKDFTKVNRLEILCEDESFMKPLSSDASTLDGLDVLCGILDEFGEATNTEMIEVLESSMAQQLEGLILIISTTTKNLVGPMFSIEYKFIEKLLNEEVKADAYLALCWEMDSLSEVDDKSNWIKANPLFEIADAQDVMFEHKVNSLDEYKAKNDLSGWLTKEMNFWVQSSQDAFIQKEQWEAIKETEKIDITGRPVFIGMDLARTGDMTAVTWVVPIIESKKLYIDSHAWIASVGGIQKKTTVDKIPYRQYEDLGLVSISKRKDGLIDTADMCEWIKDFVDTYDLDLQGIYYDPHQATPAVINLENEFPDKLIEVPQRIQYLNAPTKYLRDAIIKQEVTHSDNPLLNRAVYNAVMREFADNIAIEKAMNRNKIDPIDALINAMSEAMYFDFNYISIKELIESGEYGYGV